MICWGGRTGVTTSGLDLNFPMAFNNYVRIAAVRMAGANTTSDSHVFVRALALTKFNAYATSGTTNVSYITIGN